MASRKILTSLGSNTITKDGQKVALGIATSTETWRRTDEWARAQEAEFTAAVEDHPNPLPAGTAKMISRNNKHKSTDPNLHFSACCYNAAGKFLKTLHVRAKEGDPSNEDGKQ